MKRAFDVVVSFFALVALSPIFLVASVLVKATSRGPVFHKGSRAGLHGIPFQILKFRTMKIDAASSRAITIADDPRVTRIGRWLRRSKIDELPQFINVLKGEMSIVGPRPEDPRYVALYTAEQRRVLMVRPGISSVASVAFRHEQELLLGDNWEQLYVNEIMPKKLQIELRMIDQQSFFGDLRVIVKTALALVR